MKPLGKQERSIEWYLAGVLQELLEVGDVPSVHVETFVTSTGVDAAQDKGQSPQLSGGHLLEVFGLCRGNLSHRLEVNGVRYQSGDVWANGKQISDDNKE
jgi:hypothetical protein